MLTCVAVETTNGVHTKKLNVIKFLVLYSLVHSRRLQQCSNGGKPVLPMTNMSTASFSDLQNS